MDATDIKMTKLNQYLCELGSVAVAFSGGVDSAFLLQTAHEVLGEHVVAVTVQSGMFPMRELKQAEQFCVQAGIRHCICIVDEQKIEGFAANPGNRCYLCKRQIMHQILEIAKEERLSFVVEGSNLDDEGDYRPGQQAIAELGIKSPLKTAGMTKADIRKYANQAGLSVWNKPSAACLASRFVYGETITKEKLSMVDHAEQLLLDMGFRQMRVRIHGTMARIEVCEDEFDRLIVPDIRHRIICALRSYGFSYVAMDLQGYRTGSMNETLSK